MPGCFYFIFFFFTKDWRDETYSPSPTVPTTANFFSGLNEDPVSYTYMWICREYPCVFDKPQSLVLRWSGQSAAKVVLLSETYHGSFFRHLDDNFAAVHYTSSYIDQSSLHFCYRSTEILPSMWCRTYPISVVCFCSDRHLVLQRQVKKLAIAVFLFRRWTCQASVAIQGKSCGYIRWNSCR